MPESVAYRSIVMASQSASWPWLLMIGLRYRQFRAFVPVRTLATQDPRGALQWLMPLIGDVVMIFPEGSANVVERLGGIGPFKQGLYASSEMLVDGFLELYRSGS